jgi:hypothetical protein
MDIDLNAVLEEAATENRQLRDEIEALEKKLKRAETGNQRPAEGTGSRALCKGCYRWRLFFAALLGLACGLVAAAKLNARPDMLQNISRAITKRGDAVMPVLAGLVLLTTAAPVLLTVAEWKWMQFKQGSPGLLRSIAEVWKAIRDAAKRGRK